MLYFFFFSSRRRHTRSKRDWSSDVCSSDLRGTPIEHACRSRWRRGLEPPAVRVLLLDLLEDLICKVVGPACLQERGDGFFSNTEQTPSSEFSGSCKGVSQAFYEHGRQKLW